MTTDRLSPATFRDALHAATRRVSPSTLGQVTTAQTPAAGAASAGSVTIRHQPSNPLPNQGVGIAQWNEPVYVPDVYFPPTVSDGTKTDDQSLRDLIAATEAILGEHGVTKKAPKSKRASPTGENKAPEITLIDVQEFLREHAEQIYVHISHVAASNKVQISLRLHEKTNSWSATRTLVIHDHLVPENEVEMIAGQAADAARRVLGEREAKLRTEAEVLRNKLSQIEGKLSALETSKTAVGNGEKAVEEAATRNRKLEL